MIDAFRVGGLLAVEKSLDLAELVLEVRHPFVLLLHSGDIAGVLEPRPSTGLRRLLDRDKVVQVPVALRSGRAGSHFGLALLARRLCHGLQAEGVRKSTDVCLVLIQEVLRAQG